MRSIINCFFNNKAFVLLLLSAFGMNAFLIISYPNVGGDTLRLVLPFHHLIAGQGFTFNGEPETFFSPGYGFLSFVIYLLIRDIEYSAMIVSGLSYIGMVIATYFFVYRIIDKKSAIIATAFVTFSPCLVSISYITLVDSSYAFFVLLISFMMIVEIKYISSRLHSMLIGFFLGVLTLIRPDGIMLFCYFLILLLFSYSKKFNQNTLSFYNISSRLLLYILGFSFVIFPYMLFLHHYTGAWTISTKLSLAVAGGSAISNITTDISLLDSLKTQFLDGIYYTLPRLLENIKKMLYSFAVCNFYSVIPLLVLWLVYPFYAKRRIQDFALSYSIAKIGMIVTCFVLMVLPSYLLYDIEDRYLISYWTWLNVAIAIFAYYLIRGMVDISNNRSWSVILVLLVCSVIISPFIPTPTFIKQCTLKESLIKGHGHNGLREAGFWLRDNVPVDDRKLIISRKPAVVVFYAHDKSITSNYGYALKYKLTINENIKFIDQLSLKYLILDEHYIKEMPEFKKLWSDPESAKGFGIRLVAGGANKPFQIYKRD